MARGRPRNFDVDEALDAALALFWRHGYEGTSLAALTDVMGINMPSLYAAFGNKETLFRKALDRYLQQPAAYFPTALEESTARRVTEKLFQGAIDMVMNPRHPDGCLLVQGGLATGPVAEWVCKELGGVRAKAESALRGRYERAIAEGDLPRKTDAAQLARYIVTVLWGLSVQRSGGASRSQLKGVVQLAMRAWPE